MFPAYLLVKAGHALSTVLTEDQICDNLKIVFSQPRIFTDRRYKLPNGSEIPCRRVQRTVGIAKAHNHHQILTHNWITLILDSRCSTIALYQSQYSPTMLSPESIPHFPFFVL